MFNPRVSKALPLYSALITGCLYLLIMAICNIVGYDNNTILCGDLYQQYIAFIRLFLNALTEKGNFWYSFSLYLGSPTAAVFAYYCLSPFNLLYLIPGISDSAMTILIIILKHSLAAAAFQYFIQKALHNNSVFSITFSVCYAFCGFSTAMQMHIMWLDALYLLPILILCIQRFVKKGTFFPLIPVYAFLFLSNFYMGYIVGWFSLLCFFALLVFYLNGFTKETFRIFFKKTCIFSLCVMASACCCAFILFPASMQLLESRTGDSVSDFQLFSITLPDVFNNLFIGQLQSMGSPVPLIYSGCPALILIPAYFLSKQITKKEKYIVFCLFSIYLCATQFPPIYHFLHAFEAPNWFAHRYSFCISFLILFLCVRVLPSLRVLSPKKIIVYVTILLLFYSFMIPLQRLELSGYHTNSTGLLLINACFLLGYLLCLVLFQQQKAIRYLPVLFFFLLAAELTINGCLLVKRNNFDYQSEEKLVLSDTLESSLVSALQSADSGLYRIRAVGNDMLNAPAYNQYAGVSTFSSTDNPKLRHFLSSMGIAAPFATIYDQGYTELMDMVLGLRYTIFLSKETPAVLPMPHSLPIAYLSSPAILAYTPTKDPFSNQEMLLYALTGLEYHFFSPVSADKLNINNINMNTYVINNRIFWQHISDVVANGRITYTISDLNDQRLYCYISTGGESVLDTTSPTVSGIASPSPLPYYIAVQAITEANYNADGSGSITIDFYQGANFDYSVDNLVFFLYSPQSIDDAYNSIQAGSLNITKWYNGYLEGNIIATEDKPVLFTTIPYNIGWHATMDGQSLPTISTIDDTFLAVYLPPGEHHIVLEYEDPWVAAGKLISSVSAIGILLMLFVKYRKRVHNNVKK